MVLRGGRSPVEIPREAAVQKSLFQRRSFWDLLMQIVAEGSAVYAGYSYRERADRYSRELTPAETERIRTAAEYVKYSTLRDQIRIIAFHSAELHARRG